MILVLNNPQNKTTDTNVVRQTINQKKKGRKKLTKTRTCTQQKRRAGAKREVSMHKAPTELKESEDFFPRGMFIGSSFFPERNMPSFAPINVTSSQKLVVVDVRVETAACCLAEDVSLQR